MRREERFSAIEFFENTMFSSSYFSFGAAPLLREKVHLLLHSPGGNEVWM